MVKKRCVSMLLAGGQGSRLGVLTKERAKPAVPYGGKYRIIDFALSNCVNSNIDTVGVLTQYQPLELNSYIGNGQPWDLDCSNGGVYVLPPYIRGKKGEWYKGTANAIYQNIGFVDQFNPEHLLVLSGDHIYKMDYSRMLDFHESNDADCTIAVIDVPIEEASRFGIMNANSDGSIYEFEEKPKNPKSTNASMGVYIFKWEFLKHYLIKDELNPRSTNDFGKDLIPLMLSHGCRLFAYQFRGYWKDVGTIHSLWEANMDLLDNPPVFNLYDNQWRIYGRNPMQPPHYISAKASVNESMITEGCIISGKISRSILFAGVTVGEGAEILDSIIMPGAIIEEGAKVNKAIIGERCRIGAKSVIGEMPLFHSSAMTEDSDDITVIGENVRIPPGKTVVMGAVVDISDSLQLEGGGAI